MKGFREEFKDLYSREDLIEMAKFYKNLYLEEVSENFRLLDIIEKIKKEAEK